MPDLELRQVYVLGLNMTAMRKNRKPANDSRTLPQQRMSYVVLPRPYWNLQRLSALAILTLFIFGVITVIVAHLPVRIVLMPADAPAVQPTVDAAIVKPALQPPAKRSEPPLFDIQLNASDLTPEQKQIDVLAAALPITIVKPAKIHAVPPMIEVANHKIAVRDHLKPRDEASFQQSVARNLAQKGDLRQALRFAHRAAELAPADMSLRLYLATLYDRAGAVTGALLLYRQVIQAYMQQDQTLQRDTQIGTIRRRAAYLAGLTPPQ